MSPRGAFVVRWTALAAVALLLGSSMGSVYALYFKSPTLEGASAEPAENDTWPPTAPIPLTPKTGETVATNAPELTWSPALDQGHGNLMYVVEIAYDADFSFGIVREYSNIREPRLQIPATEPLAPGIPSYWRVYAVDAAMNQGPYSFISSFTPLAAPVPPATP